MERNISFINLQKSQKTILNRGAFRKIQQYWEPRLVISYYMKTCLDGKQFHKPGANFKCKQYGLLYEVILPSGSAYFSVAFPVS